MKMRPAATITFVLIGLCICLLIYLKRRDSPLHSAVPYESSGETTAEATAVRANQESHGDLPRTVHTWSNSEPVGAPFADSSANQAQPTNPTNFSHAFGARLASSNSPSDLLDLVEITPGSFTIGTPEHEAHRRENEGPQSHVRISYRFWIGRFEVTQDQYQSIMGELPLSDGYRGADPKSPVSAVGWDDAKLFCSRLFDQESKSRQLPGGYVYRLPTEAEWEYSCRAGTSTPYSFEHGSPESTLGYYAWFVANSRRELHVVGGKRPNPWGIYDMHGNASEWCLDNLGERYPDISMTDAVGEIGGKYQVIRGGAVYHSADVCRSGFRYRTIPDAGLRYVGFRVVLGPQIVRQ